jgi:hypothetical protein
LLWTIMDFSEHTTSLTDRPRRAIRVTSVRPQNFDRAEHGARIKQVGRRLHRRSSSARRRVPLASTAITRLPKAEHMAPEWQTAMEVLILVATRNGPTMLARIGVMKALNRHAERVFNPDRKDPHWGKGKLARNR